MSVDAVLSPREQMLLEQLAGEWCRDYHEEPSGTPYDAPAVMLERLARRVGMLRPAQVEAFREAWRAWVRSHGNGGAVGRSSTSGRTMGPAVRRAFYGK